MALGTYNPLTELDQIRREFDRLFDERMESRERWPFRFSFLPGRSARSYPLMNMREDGENIIVDGLAPGLDPDTLKVSVMRENLTIEGEKQPSNGEVKPEEWHRNERSTGRFVRTLRLPSEVEADKVEAQYRDGILHITLPKSEAARPRRIEVSVG